jgi:aminoglycoside 6'-N-acetyltransferase
VAPDPTAVAFRPVSAADLPMLADWLARPHWREWWGDPETELGYIRAMVEGRDGTRPFIAEMAGEPVGYIHMWFVPETRVEPWISEAPWLRDLPDDAVGVDLSVADPERLGAGLGTAILRAFVAELRREGRDVVVIDPHATNARAVRAYEKAGFRPIPELLGRTGEFLVMRHDAEETP